MELDSDLLKPLEVSIGGFNSGILTGSNLIKLVRPERKYLLKNETEC